MNKITIDLFSKVKFLSKLKHRGDYLSYVVSTGDLEDNKYEANIYLYDLFKKSHRKLTAGKKDSTYLWLNDEEILFQSSRQEKKEKVAETVFYKINVHGGEAEPFITLPYQVRSAEVFGDKLYCVVSYHETSKRVHELEGHEKTDYIKSLKEDDDYDVITELPFWSNGGSYNKGGRGVLVEYDFESKETKELTQPPFDVGGIHVEKEYDKIYVIGKAFTDINTIYNELYILENGLKKIGFEENFSYRKVIQTDDNHVIVYGSDHETYGLFENGKFYKINLNTNEIVLMTPDLKLATSNAVGSDLRFGNIPSPLTSDKDGVYFMLLNNFNNEIHKLTDDGSEKVLSLKGALDEFVYVGGKFYGIGLFDQQLSELYCLDDMTCLSEYNKTMMTEYDWHPVEHFEFENRSGIMLDGFIILPHKLEKKMPTILNIHGGPKTVYGDVLYHEMQYWASEGYVVIFTNPRGSDGRDNEFADIRGKYGTIDYDDIMDFVDEAIERYDVIDVDNMGVTGGSYGGFMTNWIIGHTNRFKAAATQRSISNWFSFFGTSDIGYFFAPDQVASTPWDDPEKMWMQSPLKYADQIETPTLIIHSHADYRCWTPDAYQLFSALKYFNVPSKMVLFKGENHELSRGGLPKHRVRRLKEITEWMDNYLKSQ